jgi:hypothetical protein
VRHRPVLLAVVVGVALGALGCVPVARWLDDRASGQQGRGREQTQAGDSRVRENLHPWRWVSADPADGRQLTIVVDDLTEHCTGVRATARESAERVVISVYLRGLRGVVDGFDCSVYERGGVFAEGDHPRGVAMTLASPLANRALDDAACHGRMYRRDPDCVGLADKYHVH